MSFKWLSFFTVLPRAIIRAQPKVYGGVFCKYIKDFQLLFFFAKKTTINFSLCSKNASVACKEKETNDSYMILHNFRDYTAFIDIKQTLHYNIVNIICIAALCLFSISSLGNVLQWLFQTGFFHLGDKNVGTGRVRQVVVLYSNDCMGIGLGGLSLGRLIEVVV